MKRIKRAFVDGKEIIELSLEARHILRDPLLNKGTGFTREEREELGIEGLIPYHVSTIEEQVERRYHNFSNKKSDLAKYQFLTALQDRNETLFFRLALDYIEEMLPLVYTPTVGEASIEHSYLYNQNRGVYLPYPSKHHLEKIIGAVSKEDVEVIVVTDGSRILGLGDLGTGGMVIPVGKLALYTIFGGVHPSRCLPVLLDLGTDNQKLLDDPLYLGWRHKRIDGPEYDEFIECFVQAVKKRYPKVLLQWEDFSKNHAKPLLTKYQKQICSFNDDIQGTAAVVLSGLLAATDRSLENHQIVIFGGGSAGTGIADLIVDYLMRNGLSKQQAIKLIYIIDAAGLVTCNDKSADHAYKRSLDDLAGWEVSDTSNISLLEVMKNTKASILIGTSAQAGAFTRAVVEEMAKHSERPIIFPLSNPTDKAEAHPVDLLNWTNGKAIIATGSPFRNVEYQGKKIDISQCNNVYIFPGLGLGTISVQAREVTTNMQLKAAITLSHFGNKENIFPKIKDLRNVSKKIAIAVAKEAIENNVSDRLETEVEKLIEQNVWFPEYPKVLRFKS